MEYYRNPHAQTAGNLVRDTSLLILRLSAAAGILFYHGWSTAAAGWHHIWHKTEWPFLDAIASHRFPLPVASSITIVSVSLLCSLFLALGLLCRIGSGVLLGCSLVAASLYLHYPEVTERLGLYSAIFLVLFLAGPGSFSIDAALTRRRPRKA